MHAITYPTFCKLVFKRNTTMSLVLFYLFFFFHSLFLFPLCYREYYCPESCSIIQSTLGDALQLNDRSLLTWVGIL
jgi:hypothetical protein